MTLSVDFFPLSDVALILNVLNSNVLQWLLLRKFLSAIAFRWMEQDPNDNKSALVQVMAWCF